MSGSQFVIFQLWVFLINHFIEEIRGLKQVQHYDANVSLAPTPTLENILRYAITVLCYSKLKTTERTQFISPICLRIYVHRSVHRNTECPRRNVPDFGRVFLMLKYTDITQNTCIQSWTVTEIMAREKCGLLAVPRTQPVQLTRHVYTKMRSQQS